MTSTVIAAAIDADVYAYRAKLEAEALVALAAHGGVSAGGELWDAKIATQNASKNAHDDFTRVVLREALDAH